VPSRNTSRPLACSQPHVFIFISTSFHLSREAHDPGQAAMAEPKAKPSVKRQSSFEMASDKAAAAFVRRVLVSPHLTATNTSHADAQPVDAPAIDASLPPLTSNNEIDLQLYALIAILVKDCVYSWYSRFSSDPDLVDDLLQVIAHCTRALEERLRHVDLEQLLLDVIPAIIEAHIKSK